ncbi:hypothetical protein [Catellatospora coxensis]|uniref:Uncharacterized protein n=1 Tax=Catellatospora coxensis TaxID=310354 RepID=A0A8J3L2X5_9ACTN|nr:hypothetical protein [Catellatospora coxensis]GIG10813.1 hypothetical protein Cco03nite_75130 [Catellatospora coxensis]
MTFSALTGPIRWVVRLSARMLTALALMSLLLAPSATQAAAQLAPRPQAEQVAESAASDRHEAEPAPAAAPVRIGTTEAAPTARIVVDTGPLPASAHLRAQGSRAPPA